MSTPAEPTRRGSVVRDRNGDIWQRGNHFWTCRLVLEGGPIQHLARQEWAHVRETYGPLVQIRDATPFD